MTFTGAIGTGSKWLLDRIVGAIAATGINPNLLTFLGLVVNFGAAANFAVGNFRTGAIIIFMAGFLDMLDGQVARRQNRVTAFGAFYDSTLDRYADMALYMGLLVYYSVSGRTPYVVLAAVATAGSVMVSYARARAESLIPTLQGWLYGAAGAPGAPDYRRDVQPHGASALGDRGDFNYHGDSPHRVHLAGNPRRPHFTRPQVVIALYIPRSYHGNEVVTCARSAAVNLRTTWDDTCAPSVEDKLSFLQITEKSSPASPPRMRSRRAICGRG